MIKEFVHALLAELFAGVVIAGGASLPEALKRLFRKGTEDASAREIREVLEQLGELSRSHICRLVKDWAQRYPQKLRESQLEELENLLWALSRGANFITSQGKPCNGPPKLDH